MTTAIKQHAWLLDADGRPQKDAKGQLLPQVEVFFPVVITPDGNASPSVVVTSGSILSAIWAGAIDTNAPDPELFGEGQIGANESGISTGLTYHVVGAVDSKAWVLTGGTVANLYGA